MARKAKTTEAAVETPQTLYTSGWDEFPEELLLPIGKWMIKSAGVALVEPKKEGQSRRILFFYNPVEPMADVDPEAVADLGDYDFTANQVMASFFFGTARDKKKIYDHLMKHEGFEMPEGTAEETLDNGDLRRALAGTYVIGDLDVDTFTNADGEKEKQNSIASFSAPSDDEAE